MDKTQQNSKSKFGFPASLLNIELTMLYKSKTFKVTGSCFIIERISQRTHKFEEEKLLVKDSKGKKYKVDLEKFKILPHKNCTILIFHHLKAKACFAYGEAEAEKQWSFEFKNAKNLNKSEKNGTILIQKNEENLGEIMFPNGDKYTGNMFLSFIPHGKGELVDSSNNSIFEGNFYFGIPHGKGKKTWENKGYYDGDWNYGKQEGQGEYHYFASGDFYEGQWKDNFMEGNGVKVVKDKENKEFIKERMEGKFKRNIFKKGIMKKFYKGNEFFDEIEGVFHNEVLIGEGQKTLNRKNCITVEKGVFNFGELIDGESICTKEGVTVTRTKHADKDIETMKILINQGEKKIEAFIENLKNKKNITFGFYVTVEENGEKRTSYHMPKRKQYLCFEGEDLEEIDIFEPERLVEGDLRCYKIDIKEDRLEKNDLYVKKLKNFENSEFRILIKEGYFENWILDGEGKEYYLDGSIYTGNFKKGQPHKEGEMLYKDGSKFIGKFKKGKKVSGVVIDTEGAEKNIIFTEDSEFIFDDETMKTGTINSKGLIFKGEINFPSGPNGKGVVYLQNGDIYKGNFIGIFKPKEGYYEIQYGEKNEELVEFKGEFEDFKKDGKGKQIYKNGDRFEGEFWGGEICSGTLEFGNGGKYIGGFTRGRVFNGKGEIKFPHGTSYKGEFVNSKFRGKGEIKFPHGTSYKGEFVNSKFHGKGEFTNKEGVIFTCDNWKVGKCTGVTYLLYPNQKKYVIYFREENFNEYNIGMNVLSPCEKVYYDFDQVESSKSDYDDFMNEKVEAIKEEINYIQLQRSRGNNFRCERFLFGSLPESNKIPDKFKFKILGKEFYRKITADLLFWINFDLYEYKGDMKKKKRHGGGTVYLPDGNSICSNWIEGELDPKYIRSYNLQDNLVGITEGHYFADIFISGFGRITFKNGDTITGKFSVNEAILKNSGIFTYRWASTGETLVGKYEKGTLIGEVINNS